ncbi:MAG: chitobiase/beta-hexosaminidase C-terminal domain-containing protein [Candidatus Cloacimonadota bacterium]
MKKLIFLLVLSVLMIGAVWAQGAENFENHTLSGTTYVNGSFVGSNNITWTYVQVTGEQTYPIENKGILLRRSDAPSSIKSSTVSGGIGSLSVQMRKAFTSTGDRQIALYINNTWIANSQTFGAPSGGDTTVHTFSVDNINITGNVTIELRHITGNTSNRQLVIDNLTWTGYSGGGTPTVSAPTFNPAGGFYTTAQNVSLSCETESASIHYSTTSAEGPWSDYTSAISVSGATTIWAYATKDGMVASSVTSATYSFPVEVTNIAALRASATGTTVYKLTDEAVLTFQQTNRNQKYIQDDTAAILIDDATGVITTSYNLYDGITGIVGTIGLYNGMLQFTPTQNPGAATSTGNTVIPEVRTLASLTSADQGKLIKVTNVTLDTTSGSFSATAQSITVTQGETTGTIRTFPATDYSNTVIPSGAVDLVCLVGQYNTTMQISPRFLSDFSTYYDIPEDVVTTVGSSDVLITGGPANIVPEGVIPPVNNGSFTASQSMVLNLIGDGPWNITIDTDALWGAYHRSGVWTEVANVGGFITFEGITAAKDMDLPIVLGDEDPTLPVELSSFTYTINTANLLVLQWVSQSETNLSGYKVYRNSVENLETALLVSPLIDATNSASTANYQFVDEENLVQGAYYYWLQSLDLDGTNSFYGPISVNYVLQGGEAGNPVVPLHTHLKPVYPNPFNPIAFIGYFLTEAAPVKVLIYNARGQIVARWDNAPALEGMNRVEWNGNDLSGSPCGSGIYFVKMLTEGKVYTQKALLVK